MSLDNVGACLPESSLWDIGLQRGLIGTYLGIKGLVKPTGTEHGQHNESCGYIRVHGIVFRLGRLHYHLKG